MLEVIDIAKPYIKGITRFDEFNYQIHMVAKRFKFIGLLLDSILSLINEYLNFKMNEEELKSEIELEIKKVL